MNHQGLRWNVHCVANVALRIRLNLYKRGFKIYDLLVYESFTAILYVRDDHCPGVMLRSHSLNCLMYADDLLVLSPSPEGLQKSINVIKKHAEEWKLKVNTKKSNIIIFSGNGQTKNNENFQYGSETLPIVDKQTYLGIEMTSSGRYTYARDILSKKAYKVLVTVKRVFSNSDTTTITTKNKLFDSRVKPILLPGCEIWGPELLSSYKTHFDKSTIEQVHISSSVNKH